MLYTVLILNAENDSQSSRGKHTMHYIACYSEHSFCKQLMAEVQHCHKHSNIFLPHKLATVNINLFNTLIYIIHKVLSSLEIIFLCQSVKNWYVHLATVNYLFNVLMEGMCTHCVLSFKQLLCTDHL